MVTTDEDELIRRAQKGDRDSFCQLAKLYERRIYTLALHYCRDPHDAEDLSQEVWLKAFRAIADFRAEASFHTWLRRITIHAFLNHRRAGCVVQEHERRPLVIDSLDALANEPANACASHTHGSEHGFHQKILAGRVLESLRELTPQQRLIFLLKHREGMTYQEIAAELGCSAGSVKKALYRAVLKLRAALGVAVETAEDVALEACEGR